MALTLKPRPYIQHDAMASKRAYWVQEVAYHAASHPAATLDEITDALAQADDHFTDWWFDQTLRAKESLHAEAQRLRERALAAWTPRVVGGHRQEPSYTYAALRALRQLDVEHPDWDDARKDRLDSIAQTLWRLSGEDEIERAHIECAYEVLHAGKHVHYCPNCRAVVLTPLGVGVTYACQLCDTPRNLLLIDFPVAR